MLVKGDLKCLHCGHVSGEWVGTQGAPLQAIGYKGAQDQQPRTDSSGTVRCSRCEGPVFLEAPQPVINAARLRRIRRLREQIAALDARRRRAA
jgi:hypothetical protein